jgi:hypothetical protein
MDTGATLGVLGFLDIVTAFYLSGKDPEDLIRALVKR